MTVVTGASPGRDETRGPAPDVPVRAGGVQLIGEMRGSGYREPPALARRADGQTIQLSGLLYLVLEAVDGERSYDEVAAVVSEAFGRTVSADNVRSLVESQLRPSGLVRLADGSEPAVTKSNPLLALRFKYAVSDPERTRRLTAPFGWLFHPVVVVAVLAALGVVSWWVFFEKGLASATHDAFQRPGLLLLVVLVTVLSAGFHEFGHAAAARRGGATPGVMGAGLYLVWPAFYTDVTDSYRLGRKGRVLTDLGGLYFNAIVAVAIGGIWWLDPRRRAAPGGGDADPADGAAADARRPLRRLPRAGRRDRRTRPVPADPAHAARAAAVELAQARDADPQAVGARRGQPVGGRGRPDAAVLAVVHGARAAAHPRHGLGERGAPGDRAPARLGPR